MKNPVSVHRLRFLGKKHINIGSHVRTKEIWKNEKVHYFPGVMKHFSLKCGRLCLQTFYVCHLVLLCSFISEILRLLRHLYRADGRPPRWTIQSQNKKKYEQNAFVIRERARQLLSSGFILMFLFSPVICTGRCSHLEHSLPRINHDYDDFHCHRFIYGACLLEPFEPLRRWLYDRYC